MADGTGHASSFPVEEDDRVSTALILAITAFERERLAREILSWGQVAYQIRSPYNANEASCHA